LCGWVLMTNTYSPGSYYMSRWLRYGSSSSVCAIGSLVDILFSILMLIVLFGLLFALVFNLFIFCRKHYRGWQRNKVKRRRFHLTNMSGARKRATTEGGDMTGLDTDTEMDENVVVDDDLDNDLGKNGVLSELDGSGRLRKGSEHVEAILFGPGKKRPSVHVGAASGSASEKEDDDVSFAERPEGLGWSASATTAAEQELVRIHDRATSSEPAEKQMVPPPGNSSSSDSRRATTATDIGSRRPTSMTDDRRKSLKEPIPEEPPKVVEKERDRTGEEPDHSLGVGTARPTSTSTASTSLADTFRPTSASTTSVGTAAVELAAMPSATGQSSAPPSVAAAPDAPSATGQSSVPPSGASAPETPSRADPYLSGSDSDGAAARPLINVSSVDLSVPPVPSTSSSKNDP